MTRKDVPADLLADVKNYLNITWDDDATDNKVRGMIAAGAAYLDKKLGRPADYEADGLPRSLLFDYVRYTRDSALDVYENNYISLILSAQNEGMVSGNVVEGSISPED